MKFVKLSDFSKPVLAFDSALGGCVVAVLKPGEAPVFQTFETQREQAVKLVPMIQAAMDQAGVDFKELGLIVTSIGPGSFTGLRISLSTARSMSLALNVPLQGVGTLKAMARSCVREDEGCTVLLETKRADFYAQSFGGGWSEQSEPYCASSPEIFQRIKRRTSVLCGDALFRFEQELGQVFDSALYQIRHRALLDPVQLAYAGVETFLENNGKVVKAEPLYLREADVSISQKIQRQIQDIP